MNKKLFIIAVLAMAFTGVILAMNESEDRAKTPPKQIIKRKDLVCPNAPVKPKKIRQFRFYDPRAQKKLFESNEGGGEGEEQE